MSPSFIKARLRKMLFRIAFFLVLGTGVCAAQQAAPSAKPAAPQSGVSQRIYVVLPFENASASAKLDWLSEGLEELTIERLTDAGEQVYSHDGRASELERYGLPLTSKFSRATMIRLAEDLDADYVIYGRYASNGTTFTLEMRTLSMNPLGLRPALQESGSLDSLMELHKKLLWRVLMTNDKHYRLGLADFTKKQRPLRLDAFEQYSRGLLATDDETKLRQLHAAAQLEPDWPDPDFALGQAYFAKKDYNSALAWFFKVPKTHDRYPEALFYSGVCRLQLNQPDRAEEEFHTLQDNLRSSNTAYGADLPEILNNLAIAEARLGKSAAAQSGFQRATQLDPGEDDYPINLGLLALQNDDPSAAADDFREASEREPDSAEDRALLILALDKADRKAEADQEREEAKEAFGPNGLPVIEPDGKNETLAKLARIKTELDVSGLRAEVETPAAAD